MAELGFQQTQRIFQAQTQKMSQQQIYSLNLLAMNSNDLRSEIYSAVEKNPALELASDSTLISETKKMHKNQFSSDDYVRIGSSSAAGQEKSDKFQEILESRADDRASLHDYLMSQLNVLKISSEKFNLSKKLIDNLNSAGFHILAPVSLLEKDNPSQNSELLDACICIVRHLDPIGTCCTDFKESLFVQASYRPDSPPAALFLLDGKFDFLDPPRPARILKRIQNFVNEQKKMAFATENIENNDYYPENYSLEDIEDALAFIRKLDPYPARQFGSSSSAFVSPDVFVSKIPNEIEQNDKKQSVIIGNQFSYRITAADNVLPSVQLSPGYVEFDEKSVSSSEKKFINDSVHEAKIFIENLNFRKRTIIQACSAIVRAQLLFFEKGPEFLAPLRQKDIADVVGVHEATISRMANSKYIQCEWGLFPVKYFFSNAVTSFSSKKSAESDQDEKNNQTNQKSQNSESISQESVKVQISQIIQAQMEGSKRLSDQKISDLLAERGIKVARRTVAKYRSQLNIDSSYSR